MHRLKEHLEDKGCQVEWVDSGAGSLARLRRKYFDVVVLDRQQPAFDDFETILNISPELIHIPVLLLNPSDGVEKAITGLKIEITHYLIKSMINPRADNEDTLLNIINQISYLTSRYN